MGRQGRESSGLRLSVHTDKKYEEELKELQGRDLVVLSICRINLLYLY
ncbi:hypothetical protein SAMN02745219_01035 [Desulfofundulus thermosubterraneus DSM 16057]|uniref:Uncharacterized protein n=1 Tax=Desulfofundulus thermosubterraneus DSM 16057 TaxID=1121432 RepID=A0A1M6DX12_9FIRM|nr:hypothetical protein SAMN02745219_01035 [Desulfofundulus thermosubterraneus DSM 16057]